MEALEVWDVTLTAVLVHSLTPPPTHTHTHVYRIRTQHQYTGTLL